MSPKIIAFDLDDTICSRPKYVEDMGPEKYKHCVPIPEMVERVNKLYYEGHTIIIYTARGMHTLNGDVKEIYNRLFDLTTNHLIEWGVKYHLLVMGKIHYDLLIDDKAACFDNIDKFLENLK